MVLKSACFVIIFMVICGFSSVKTECPIPIDDALIAAYASKHVYNDAYGEGKIISIPGAQNGFKIIKVIKPENMNLKVIVAINGFTKIIAFRGTNGGKQLIDQIISGLRDVRMANARLSNMLFQDGNIKVQSFMVNSFNTLLGRLKEHLVDDDKGKYKYIITGHSLGGALASLLALYTNTTYKASHVWKNKDSSLITFGEVRAGGPKFAKLHDRMVSVNRKLRFVYRTDIVPHIPYSSVNVLKRSDGIFTHHSREIWIAGKGVHGVHSGKEPQCIYGGKFQKATCNAREKLRQKLFAIKGHMLKEIEQLRRFLRYYHCSGGWWARKKCQGVRWAKELLLKAKNVKYAINEKALKVTDVKEKLFKIDKAWKICEEGDPDNCSNRLGQLLFNPLTFPRLALRIEDHGIDNYIWGLLHRPMGQFYNQYQEAKYSWKDAWKELCDD